MILLIINLKKIFPMKNKFKWKVENFFIKFLLVLKIIVFHI